MSDKDMDVFSVNLITCQKENPGVSAKRPNINSTTFSVQDNNMPSTMNMHHDQRSMYSRRKTSSKSFRTDSGIHSRNSHHSYYTDGMGTQRSMYNGWSGSPMSVQTIDADLNAKDIALALETKKFNELDMKIIKKVYNKFMKCSVCKKMAKRRNRLKFSEGYRRVSGGQSGDLASDSSLSSDDHNTVGSSRTATCNDNASSSSSINFMNLKTTLKESGLYGQSTEHLRQNHFGNMLLVPLWRTQEDLQHKCMSKNGRRGFLLPSQNFNANQSVASLPIAEMPNLDPHPAGQMTNGIQNENQSNTTHTREPSQEPKSEVEEIFSEVAMKQKNNGTKSQRKKVLEDKNITYLVRKRYKLCTPVKRLHNCTLKPNKSKSDNKGLNVISEQISRERPKSLKTYDTLPYKTRIPRIVLNSQETFISKSKEPMGKNVSQNPTNGLTNVRAMQASVSKQRNNSECL